MDLNLAIDKEELYWEQQARVNWLKMRYCNTSFFHLLAPTQWCTNAIRCLVQDDGRLVSNQEGLLEVPTSFFLAYFLFSMVDNADGILAGVDPCITDSMNESHLARFHLDEMFTALKSMFPLKASGLDGFPALFSKVLAHC